MTSAGAAAERLAQDFLERRGLQILARNYRCRFGEIDLVAHDGNTLVFVEVRLRTHAAFGDAAGSVTALKQRKLIKAAQHYLRGEADPSPCRFDLVLLSGLHTQAIDWIPNAFGLTE